MLKLLTSPPITADLQTGERKPNDPKLAIPTIVFMLAACRRSNFASFQSASLPSPPNSPPSSATDRFITYNGVQKS